jgi:gas vesicle protein
MSETEKTNGAGVGSGVITFLAGAALGAGFALLATPKTGREMRDCVSELTDDALTKIREFATEAQAKLNRAMDEGRQMMKEREESIAAAIDAGKKAME